MLWANRVRSGWAAADIFGHAVEGEVPTTTFNKSGRVIPMATSRLGGGLLPIVLSWCLLTHVPYRAAAQAPPDSAIFSGLTTVAVDVAVTDVLERYVSVERLKTVMELELRRSGLQVVDMNSNAKRDGHLILELLALTDETRSGEVVGFSVARLVDFDQRALIARNGMFTIASTWTDHAVHYWGIERARDAAEDATRAAAEAFINRYLASR